MGYTGVQVIEVNRCPGTDFNEKVKSFLDKELTGIGFEVLKSSKRGSEYYAAAKVEQDVIGIVAKCELEKTLGGIVWFNYKLMSETEGPYYYNCPKGILKLLTPTTAPYAIAWRQKCMSKFKEAV